jgi:hypothetical protein
MSPGPNRVPNRTVRHLPEHVITFLNELFNAFHRKQYFLPAWKQVRVVSTLKPRKYPTLPSSYDPLGYFNTVGNIFEKILLTRVIRQANEHGLCGMRFSVLFLTCKANTRVQFKRSMAL